MIPEGVATAYRLRIAYFDVIPRQRLPKSLHFLSTSSSSYSIARLSLKATVSAIKSPHVNFGKGDREKIMGYGPDGSIKLNVSMVSSTRMSCGSRMHS